MVTEIERVLLINQYDILQQLADLKNYSVLSDHYQTCADIFRTRNEQRYTWAIESELPVDWK